MHMLLTIFTIRFILLGICSHVISLIIRHHTMLFKFQMQWLTDRGALLLLAFCGLQLVNSALGIDDVRNKKRENKIFKFVIIR